MDKPRGAIVDVDHVTVVRGGRAIVDDVSFRIDSGELLVLIGPSGSGKTTLLTSLNRLSEIDAGAVKLDGENIRDLPLHELRRRVGYCFQGLGLFPHLSVADNVGITPRLLGWAPERIARRVDELLAKVGLDVSFRGRLPHQLSGGQAQRVAVARALAAEPPLLLLDEPFGALDPDTRGHLQEELAELQRAVGVTTVLVSHDLAEALLLATRIGVVDQGKIVQLAPPAEVLARPATPVIAALVDSARRRAQSLVELAGAAVPRGRAS